MESYSENARLAMEHLRDGSTFNWTVIPTLVVVIYIYSVEVERRNWDVFFAGLAFWGMDWFNEIWNGLVLHFTGYAPCWGAPGDSAFLILVGLNIEICFMFAFLGITGAKMLPKDKSLRILGIPNRWFMGVTLSAVAVIIEFFLNAVDALTWDWWWWSMKSPLPILVFGYLHFFMVAFWVHDMPRLRSKITTVSVIFAFDAACLVLFGAVLGWI